MNKQKELGIIEKMGKKGRIYRKGERILLDFDKQTIAISGASWGENPTIYFQSVAMINGKKVEGIRADKEICEKIEMEERQIQAEKTKVDYAELHEKMKNIPVPENNLNPDESKMQELIAQIDTTYFSGPEMDGVNLSVSAQNDRLRQEAQKYCNHDFETEFDHTHTADARRKLIRKITCEKCGFEKRNIVQEDVSEEALWR